MTEYNKRSEMPHEEVIAMYERFHNEDKMYLVLGTLISADTNFDIPSVEKSIYMLNDIKTILPKCNIDEEKKTEYLDYIEKGLMILERDLDEFKEEGYL